MRLAATKLSSIHQYRGLGNQLYDAAGVVPSLDLDLATNKTLTDNASGQQRVTFTRASSGTFVGSDGLLKTATTNLLLQSEDFSTTWIKDASSVLTTNTAPAPNGSVTADKFAVGASTFPQIAQAVTGTVSLTHSFSIYVKAAGLDFIQLRVRSAGASTNYFRAIFNLATGAVTSAITNGTGVIVSATTVNAGDGWWRCTLTGIADTTGTSVQPLAILATDASGTLATSSNSAATDGVLFWGAQLEQSPTVGEYIPTTSTINSAPRFDHNPTTGESLGLLVEEQRTNLLLQSNQFDTTWTNASSSETAAAGIAPDGTNTAWELKDTLDTVLTSHIISQPISFVSGATYTVSVWMKAGTLSQGGITFSSGAFGSTLASRINLSTGDILASSVGVTTSVTPFPNDWYKITATATATATISASVQIRLMNGGISYIGTGTGTVLIWGAQTEVGSFPTSYIPTTTATATRSADVASITGANFSSWYNHDEGTLRASASIRGGNTVVSSGLAIVNGVAKLAETAVTVNSRALVLNTTATPNRYSASQRSTASNISVVDNAYEAIQFGKHYGLGVSYTNNSTQGLAFSVDGRSVVTNATAVDVPISTRLLIGAGNSGTNAGQGADEYYLNGTIKRLTYWPQRLPNATLQQITQP
jgi:hypothetical protein